ncbi:beta-propeller domain-containing protein [Methylomicrobium lacus]|uniref:beta-propeller domain-containing protein n=1 Tax=Methylomicrobium lacus TaxID=136992 RepID=UPI0035A8C4A2
MSHSETNVQVAGVDEGDIVKTNDGYIYQIAENHVRLVKAYPSQALAQVAELAFGDEFRPSELYVDGDRLVVLGNAWQSGDGAQAAGPANGVQTSMPLIWLRGGANQAAAKIYDISDKANPRLERELTLEGDLLSSRKIGDSVYVISKNYPRYDFYLPMSELRLERKKASNALDNLIPHVSDTAVNGGTEQMLPVSKLYYFPGFVDSDYVVVAGFRLSQPDNPADVKAYYGSGDVIYASHDNLYLSAADYKAKINSKGIEVSKPFTHIYKFALQEGETRFLRQGEVPGTVLNQFSMDDSNGFFRIATTSNSRGWDGSPWQGDSWSNLYVLDSDMNRVGAVEKLALGERIYAARFIGERCYLVTFQQTDPLFVIDLATPDAPTVLGELKIPGYSTYLHPYDANHIIGFGQDTETDLGITTTLGLKLALFDVSDVNNPQLKHSLVIGDKGSYSPLLRDHKALWFDEDRHLLGFPAKITQKPDNIERHSWWNFVPVFEGAYVYQLTPEDGFVQKAAIMHQTQNDPSQWDYRSDIQRLLTIDDQLYTLSESRIQSQDLVNFEQTGFVEWQASEDDVPVEIQPAIVSQPAPLD